MALALDGAKTLDDMLKAFQRWADATIGDVAWTVFEVEFATRARQDEQVRRGLAQRNAQIRDAVATFGVGLGVQRAIDPGVGVAVLPGVIRILTGG
jgi:hypothetical protein